MYYKCFLRLFNKSDSEAYEFRKIAIEKIYEGAYDEPPYFEVSNWKGIVQIEITGRGEDGRCAFCEYVVQMVGAENVKRNNCPFY